MKRLYLPSRDRSFWQTPTAFPSRLAYLAWGRRDFRNDAIPQSQHDGWVTVLVEEGSPTLKVAAEKIRLGPGALVLIGPECSFGWSSEADSDCRFVLWMWDSMQLHIVSAAPKADFWLRYLTKRSREPLLDLHENCRREVLALDSISPTYLEGCFLQFCALLERIFSSPEKEALNSVRIEQALEWMSQHLDSREPIARLCDYLNISQSTLHRLFKQRLEQSPAQKFHQLRMEYARDRLKSGDIQIKEVAYSLGYDHFNDFSRAYRLFWKKSPSAENKENASP